MRNLTALSNHSMLNVTRTWLDDSTFVGQLQASGGLGVAIHKHLGEAHQGMAEIEHNRSEAQARLRGLVVQSGLLDKRHDASGRGLNLVLRGLAELADSEERATYFRELEARLFPTGLAVLRLPYVEEGGAAVALEESISPTLRAELADIPVGKHTLETILDRWLTAGRELGVTVHERAKLRASLRKQGSAVSEVDITARRRRWFKAVRGLLWAIDMEASLAEMEESVVAVLEDAIRSELTGSSGVSKGPGQEPDELVEGEGEEGEVEVVDVDVEDEDADPVEGLDGSEMSLEA